MIDIFNGYIDFALLIELISFHFISICLLFHAHTYKVVTKEI